MARRRQTLYIAQLGSYAAADPSANGAGYLWVPASNVPTKQEELAHLETNFATGSVYPTAPEAGPDGGMVELLTHIGGFATAGGDGAAPPALDWFDILMNSAFGSYVERSGEGLGAGSTTGSLVLDTDLLSIYDLAPVYEAGLAPGRTQWARIEADAGSGTYGTVAPLFATAPTTAGVCYATRMYRPSDAQAYLAAVFVDDNVRTHTLLGVRAILQSISADHGRSFMAKWRLEFDSKTTDVGKTSLPNPGAAPAFRTLDARLSPVYFNGTAVETSKIEINMNPTVQVLGATAATQGRGGNEIVSYRPEIVVTPQRTGAIEDLRRAVTEGPLLVQLGGGVLAGGQLGTMALHLDNAFVADCKDVDDNGVMRQQLTIRVADAARFSGTTRAPVVQLARA